MAKNIEDIFIVCGEPSGDLLAGNLLEEIRRINPQVKCCGVGGKRLADAGAEIIYDIKELSVMGLLDVLKKLPRFLKLKNLILKEIDVRKPSCLILIDFSGFNLRLAAAVNKRIPVIYYVSPQIWASREKRVKRIKKFISLNIVLFRFEEEFYKKHGLRVERVGHPLLDLVKPSPDKKGLCAETGIIPGKPVVSLLPGSRKQELRLILPLMLESALIINKKNPGTQFIIAKSPALEAKEYSRICASYGNLDLKIIEGRTADCLDLAQASLVCSGTAALEAAIIQKPFVIIYKTSLFNYLLYRPQIKIPYIGIVNIIAKKEIVPEFIQFNARPEKIATTALKLLNDPSCSKQMNQALQEVKDSLGGPGAAGRAAKIIMDFLA